MQYFLQTSFASDFYLQNFQAKYSTLNVLILLQELNVLWKKLSYIYTWQRIVLCMVLLSSFKPVLSHFSDDWSSFVSFPVSSPLLEDNCALPVLLEFCEEDGVFST